MSIYLFLYSFSLIFNVSINNENLFIICFIIFLFFKLLDLIFDTSLTIFDKIFIYFENVFAILYPINSNISDLFNSDMNTFLGCIFSISTSGYSNSSDVSFSISTSGYSKSSELLFLKILSSSGVSISIF